MLIRRHAVIVDTLNFNGPKLSQFFDSTIETLLLLINHTNFHQNLLRNHRVLVFEKFKFAVSSIKHQRVLKNKDTLECQVNWFEVMV